MAEEAVGFFDIKGDLEALLAPRAVRFVRATHPSLHPGRCAGIEIDAEAVQQRDLPAPQPLPKQQSAWRDIAVVVGEGVTHEALMASIRAGEPALVRSARLFDIYRPKQAAGEFAGGERSLAIRLELLDDDATLTDERIDAAVSRVLATLGQQLGARLRT